LVLLLTWLTVGIHATKAALANPTKSLKDEWYFKIKGRSIRDSYWPIYPMKNHTNASAAHADTRPKHWHPLPAPG
jgi:hypothetical protein